MNKMNNRERFHHNASRYFDNGIISEIFYNDDFCICNIANYCYALFLYPSSLETIKEAETMGPAGFYFSVDYIKEVISDPSKIVKMSYLSKRELKRLFFRLSEKNFLQFKEIKEECDLTGPSLEIDLAMEEELKKKGYGRR